MCYTKFAYIYYIPSNFIAEEKQADKMNNDNPFNFILKGERILIREEFISPDDL